MHRCLDLCLYLTSMSTVYLPTVHTYGHIAMLLIFSHQADHIQYGVKRWGDVMIRPVQIVELCYPTCFLHGSEWWNIFKQWKFIGKMLIRVRQLLRGKPLWVKYVKTYILVLYCQNPDEVVCSGLLRFLENRRKEKYLHNPWLKWSLEQNVRNAVVRERPDSFHHTRLW